MHRHLFAAAAVALLLFAASASAGEPPFVFSINETGRVNLKFTPFEQLPNPPLRRYTDLATQGRDRYALRSDGTVFMNGKMLFAQSVGVIAAGGLDVPDAWIRMRVVGGSIYALSARGLVTRNGELVSALPGTALEDVDQDGQVDAGGEQVFFVDLIVTPVGVLALRLDGALFEASLGVPLGLFDAGPGLEGLNGQTESTVWMRLAQAGGSVLALRADGKLVAVTFSELESAVFSFFEPPIFGLLIGQVVASLPGSLDALIIRNNFYVDLVGRPSGSWYVMRRDGAVFTEMSQTVPHLPNVGPANFVGNPYTTPLTGASTIGNSFVDLEFFTGVLWRVRSLGQLYKDAELLQTLLNTRFVRLALALLEPDLSGIPDQRPFLAVYRTEALEHDPVTVPIIATDLNKAADELQLELDFSKLPGASYDPATGNVTWPGGAAGTYRFSVRVTDGVRSLRKNYRIKVRERNTDPDKNTRPDVTRISRVTSLVDIELVLPVSAVDRDGDPLTFTPSGGIFDRGATFDPITNTIHWKPTCADSGRQKAVLLVSDGMKTRKLSIKITVFFPLFW